MRHPQSHVIDAHWAGRFGCSPADLQSPGVHVVTSEETDRSRIAVLELQQATLVRVAPEHADPLEEWSRNRPIDSPRDASAVANTFPQQEWRVSPSEKVFYLDPDSFRPFQKPDVRQLSEADSSDLTAMHRGCDPKEQQAGEVNIDHPAIFGAFADGRLVAAASLIDQGESLSDVGVLVHRDFRRQGYGRAVVSALSKWGLENGRIVQYWRLCSNTGSARIADSLGFTEYGCFQVLHQSISPFR